MQRTELLYFRETLNADQAKQHNLVTRVLNWVDFDKNILTQCSKLASHQAQVRIHLMTAWRMAHTVADWLICNWFFSFRSQPNDVTKQILQPDLIHKLREALKIEQKHLIQYWISAEHQERLKNAESIANVWHCGPRDSSILRQYCSTSSSYSSYTYKCVTFCSGNTIIIFFFIFFKFHYFHSKKGETNSTPENGIFESH